MEGNDVLKEAVLSRVRTRRHLNQNFQAKDVPPTRGNGSFDSAPTLCNDGVVERLLSTKGNTAPGDFESSIDLLSEQLALLLKLSDFLAVLQKDAPNTMKMEEDQVVAEKEDQVVAEKEDELDLETIHELLKEEKEEELLNLDSIRELVEEFPVSGSIAGIEGGEWKTVPHTPLEERNNPLMVAVVPVSSYTHFSQGQFFPFLSDGEKDMLFEGFHPEIKGGVHEYANLVSEAFESQVARIFGSVNSGLEGYLEDKERRYVPDFFPYFGTHNPITSDEEAAERIKVVVGTGICSLHLTAVRLIAQRFFDESSIANVLFHLLSLLERADAIAKEEDSPLVFMVRIGDLFSKLESACFSGAIDIEGPAVAAFLNKSPVMFFVRFALYSISAVKEISLANIERNRNLVFQSLRGRNGRFRKHRRNN